MKRNFLWLIWLVSLILLPFDNFPFVKFGYLKPLSLVPMGVLVFLFFVFILIEGKKIILNKNDLIFLSFLTFILFDGFLQLFLFPSNISLERISPSFRFLEIFYFLTLMFVFYFTPRIVVSDSKTLKESFKFIVLAFLLPLIWGLFQSYYVINNLQWDQSFFRDIEKHLVSRGGVFYGFRISLFSSEPAWAACLLFLILIPILLSCWHFRYSFFPRLNTSLGKISFEPLILMLALFCLVMTFSITGVICLIFLSFLYLIFFIKKEVLYKNMVLILFLFSILLLIASPWLPYILNRINIFSQNGNSSFLVKTGHGNRVICWVVALKEFLLNPLFGVGMRNTIFYAKELTPPSFSSFEQPLTPKAFFPGLLGELGLIGFSIFLWFYIRLIWGVFKIKSQQQRVIRYSLLFSLLSLIPVGLSMDFTYPYFWFVFGLSSSFISIYEKNRN